MREAMAPLLAGGATSVTPWTRMQPARSPSPLPPARSPSPSMMGRPPVYLEPLIQPIEFDRL